LKTAITTEKRTGCSTLPGLWSASFLTFIRATAEAHAQKSRAVPYQVRPSGKMPLQR